MMKLDRNEIARLLCEKHMSMGDLAQTSLIARKTLYAHFGNSGRRAWFETVFRLARALGVDPESIVLQERAVEDSPKGE
jgi:DNA-binding phage protein